MCCLPTAIGAGRREDLHDPAIEQGADLALGPPHRRRRGDDLGPHFLSVLASLAALAIENASLYDNLKRSYDGVMDVLWGSSTS